MPPRLLSAVRDNMYLGDEATDVSDGDRAVRPTGTPRDGYRDGVRSRSLVHDLCAGRSLSLSGVAAALADAVLSPDEVRLPELQLLQTGQLASASAWASVLPARAAVPAPMVAEPRRRARRPPSRGAASRWARPVAGRFAASRTGRNPRRQPAGSHRARPRATDRDSPTPRTVREASRLPSAPSGRNSK
jgi:hypothetical protein